MTSSDIVWLVAVLVLGLIAFVVLSKFDGLSFLYDVRVTEAGIEFLFLRGMRFYVLRYSNIEEVRELRGGFFFAGSLTLRAFNFKNRFGSTTFLLKKRRGFFTRQVLVTPENTVTFRQAMEHAGVRVVSRV